MENPRTEKVAVVDEVREKLQGASAAIVTEYRGLTVGEISALRRSLREAGGEYRVYKNTLVRFAVRDLGLDELEQLLVGPTAIAFVDGDAVTVARALRDYARTNPNLVVKGGVLGTSVLSAADTAALADIPSRDVLLARFAGLLAAPMVQFAGLLQALPRNLAYGLKALIDKSGGVPEAAAEADTAAPEAAAEADTAPPEEAAADADTGAPEAATEADTGAPEAATEADTGALEAAAADADTGAPEAATEADTGAPEAATEAAEPEPADAEPSTAAPETETPQPAAEAAPAPEND